MLTTTKKLLQAAQRGHYAVGAFNISNLESFQAVMQAAETKKSPVIIQTSEAALAYAGPEFLKNIVYTTQKSRVPFALHVDHGRDIALIKACIKLGWTSVMYDGSHLPYKENLKNTRAVAQYAHARGVSVEGELGAIKGVEDHISVSERAAFYTDPAQAAEFVAMTGVDALAISIGTAHGPFKFEGETVLDFARLKQIVKLVSVPIVLHGASGINQDMIDMLHRECKSVGDCTRLSDARGVADAALKKAIKLGACKVNIDSDLRIAFTAGVRTALLEHTSWYDPRKILGVASEQMRATVAQKIDVLGSKNKW